jgi:hypothetical protein
MSSSCHNWHGPSSLVCSPGTDSFAGVVARSRISIVDGSVSTEGQEPDHPPKSGEAETPLIDGISAYIAASDHHWANIGKKGGSISTCPSGATDCAGGGPALGSWQGQESEPDQEAIKLGVEFMCTVFLSIPVVYMGVKGLSGWREWKRLFLQKVAERSNGKDTKVHVEKLFQDLGLECHLIADEASTAWRTWNVPTRMGPMSMKVPKTFRRSKKDT